MNLSSIINFGKNTSTITGYTRTFLLAVVVLVNILGVILIVLRLGNTAHLETSADATNIVPATNMAHQEMDEMSFMPETNTAYQETAGEMNPISVVDENEARPTTSVLPGILCFEMDEPDQIMKSSLERDHNVDIDFINEKLAISQEVYSTIIKIANELGELGKPRREDLESIAKKVSSETNTVTLTNLQGYMVLKATIGEDAYVLKRMGKLYHGGANDSLITKFNSPYIIEALMTFQNDIEGWVIMEYIGPGIPLSNANFTEEEIRLLVYSCLMGLDAIHESGYYHNDLHPRNIVHARNDKGEIIGFKIIDFDTSKVKNSSQMTPSELQNEVRGTLMIVKDYLKHRVHTRPENIGYMEIVDADIAIYGGFNPIVFLEEDFILADFLITAAGWVSEPATSIADLMKHQYFTEANADLFGKKECIVTKRMPSELPVS